MQVWSSWTTNVDPKASKSFFLGVDDQSQYPDPTARSFLSKNVAQLIVSCLQLCGLHVEREKEEEGEEKRKFLVFCQSQMLSALSAISRSKSVQQRRREEKWERERPADTNVNKVIVGKDEGIDHSLWRYLYEKIGTVLWLRVRVCVQMRFKVYSAVSPFTIEEKHIGSQSTLGTLLCEHTLQV